LPSLYVKDPLCRESLKETLENLNEEETKMNIIVNSSKNFEFEISIKDTLFVLTPNPNYCKEDTSNLKSKMVILNDLNYVNLDNLSKKLEFININRLNIFFINSELDNNVHYTNTQDYSDVRFIETNLKNFMILINKDANF
jgi:hypothetical protein